jgi:hypothetical protein
MRATAADFAWRTIADHGRVLPGSAVGQTFDAKG